MDENLKKQSVKDNICNLLKEGLFKKDAAIMAGISEATLYRWIEEDESFKSRVQASLIEYKRKLFNIVTKCSETDGRLALELLKRRFPNDWDGTSDEFKHSSETTTTEIAVLLQRILHTDDGTEEVELLED